MIELYIMVIRTMDILSFLILNIKIRLTNKFFSNSSEHKLSFRNYDEKNMISLFSSQKFNLNYFICINLDIMFQGFKIIRSNKLESGLNYIISHFLYSFIGIMIV